MRSLSPGFRNDGTFLFEVKTFALPLAATLIMPPAATELLLINVRLDSFCIISPVFL
jgi:hypothetical protein